MFKYKMTVIIPVYKMERYIEKCLESLVNQTIPLSKLEILIIDDGSPDESYKIYEKYARKYSCFRIIKKENEGVSIARNIGINNAKGKYIMYLDADDTLSLNAIEGLVDFFDSIYNEVDLITYKELFILEDGTILPFHYRFRSLNKTGVYDLKDFDNTFINQTNINVCVKNNGPDNILFDVKLKGHEDLKYCTEILSKKLKIGYVDEVIYYYLQQQQSTTKSTFYAYYIFEDTMSFWEQLFESFNGDIPKYVQALYLNDINWKTRSDILYPYHYEGEKFDNAVKRVVDLLDKVDDFVILSHPALDNLHRDYFLKRKSKERQIKLYNKIGTSMICDNDLLIHEFNKIELLLRKFRVVKGKIKMLAVAKARVFSYLEKPEIYLVTNGGEQKLLLECQESGWNYYRSKINTNKFWTFTAEIDLKSVKNFKITVVVNGREYDTFYYFMPQIVFNSEMKRDLMYADGYQIAYYEEQFFIREDEDNKLRNERIDKSMQLLKSLYPDAYSLCDNALKADTSLKNTWLYYDCIGVSKDNGYYQFIHDFAKEDGISRYYVIKGDMEPLLNQFTAEQQKYLVQFGSEQHKILFLNADKIITAFIEMENFLPFETWQEYNLMFDISTQPEIVYLQHGILHAHAPWKYSYDRLGADREVISTAFEVENLTNNYGFYKENLIPAGMPRYDYIEQDVKGKRKILFAPSWRNYLIGRENNQWVATEDKFINSAFYQETFKFVNSPELAEILEQYDYELDFKLHPIIERYKHLYKIESSRIHTAENKVRESDYQVFITDYSSFMFDFIYLKRAIIYFVPDYEMFKSGMSTYRELDIPLDDGFGELVISGEDAVGSLKRILENNGMAESKYMSKMESFFLYKDNNQADRVYDALINYSC